MPPTRRYYANGAPTLTTAGSITSGSTSVTVATNFTGYPTSFPYYACLDKGTTSQEIVLVTNVSGSVATIARGQDGTLGVSHPLGATVDFVAVAKDFDEANAHTSATSGVHGIAGNVVGDTDVQTLTNKTLTSPTLTAPTASGSLAGFGGAWTSYPPTLTATTTNPTLGSGSTQFGQYSAIGKTVNVYLLISFGSSGTNAGSGQYIVSLPASVGAGHIIGAGYIKCAGSYTRVLVANDGKLWYPSAAVSGTQTFVTNSVPGAWTTGDSIELNLAYQSS